MRSLTAAQIAAVAQPGVSPRTLIAFDTTYGTQRVTTEPVRWSGLDWAGQLTEPPTITTPIGDTGAGVLPAKSITVTLANADGFWSARPPEFYRGRTLTAHEVLLEVESDALATTTFRVTATQMPAGGETFVLQGEESWAAARRALVPHPRCVLDAQKYPTLDGLQVDVGNPIPVLFGRALVPLTLVDQSSANVYRYVACVGTATMVSSYLYETWDNRLNPVQTASGTLAPYSVSHVRRGIGEQQIPVTEVITAISDVTINGTRVLRYADLTCNSPGHPDQVLLGLVTDPVYGAGLSPSLVSSDALLTARSFYLANSMTFDGVLGATRPLEEWLGAWGHDALTALRLRDTLHLVPQGSRAAVASFHDGNIVARTVGYADAPEGQQASVRRLFYREASRDVSSVAVVRWAVGSGTAVDHASPFIGRRSVATRVVQHWAKEAAYGVRGYGLATTLRVAELEEGDVAQLTHAPAAATHQLAVVETVERTDGVWRVALRRTDAALWTPQDVPADLPYLNYVFRSTIAPYTSSGLPPVTYSSSHTLGVTPTAMKLQIVNPWVATRLVGSLVSATGSTFTAHIAGTVDTIPPFGVTGFILTAPPTTFEP